MSFTWVDWGIAAVICISAFISLRRGFFREVMSLMTWLLATFAAWTFGENLANYLTDYIETPSIRVMTATATLFVVILMVGVMINRFIVSLVQATGLTGTDRALGVIFGGLRGCLLVVILLGLIKIAPLEQDNAWKNSVLLPHFLVLADWSKKTLMEIVEPWLDNDPLTNII